MAHETLAMGRWLTATIGGDTTLRGVLTGVYRSLAPQGTALPYCVWDITAGDDDNTAGDRSFATALVSVKVISDDRGEKANVETAVDRIDALLKDARAIQGSVRIVVKSSGALDYTETSPDGKLYYRHQGRLWRFLMNAV
jgi:hypothetical protein